MQNKNIEKNIFGVNIYKLSKLNFEKLTYVWTYIYYI